MNKDNQIRVSKTRDSIWLILGAVLIALGFVFAHLSNANLIHWPYGLEKTAHGFFHIAGPIFLLFGIIKILTKKFRTQ